jgi:hypothetical protein
MCDGSSHEPVIALAGIDLKTCFAATPSSRRAGSTVPNSNIVGNIGVSPITAAAMTGFSWMKTLRTVRFIRAGHGHAHGASYGGAIAASLTVAVLDMHATDAAKPRQLDVSRLNVGGGDIGGMT